MKTLAVLALFGIAGCVTAIAITNIMLAFDHNPGCGLDCASPAFTAAFLSSAVTVLVFPTFGYLFSRLAKFEFARVIAVLAAMILTALLAAGGYYVLELNARYREAEAARPVEVDFDFMYMAIARRDIRTYTRAEGALAKPVSVIPQWQRCVIAGASCDRKPRQAHMRCKNGVVYVNEDDWKAFSLIPRENLVGAIPMKSMGLCEPDNVPDP
jgi:hypothetical protein